jgi:hypothetical protein
VNQKRLKNTAVGYSFDIQDNSCIEAFCLSFGLIIGLSTYVAIFTEQILLDRLRFRENLRPQNKCVLVQFGDASSPPTPPVSHRCCADNSKERQFIFFRKSLKVVIIFFSVILL